MEATAKLITAVAAIFGAVLWPAFFAVIMIAYRREIRASLARLPSLIDRARRVKGPGIEVDLDALAASAPVSGEITTDQLRAAEELILSSGVAERDRLLSRLDALCIQYDAVRRTMPAGSQRTREMTQIIAKMRAIGPSLSSTIEVFKGSGSAGSRLAAIAMMQMEPAKADIPWLKARFANELPFIFYHAALALTNAAGTTSELRAAAVNAAAEALQIVRSFKGIPDAETIRVLQALCEEYKGDKSSS